ncbi:MAG: hypothetical protein ACYC54_02435 [Sedimentisphaerales bacterium]
MFYRWPARGWLSAAAHGHARPVIHGLGESAYGIALEAAAIVPVTVQPSVNPVSSAVVNHIAPVAKSAVMEAVAAERVVMVHVAPAVGRVVMALVVMKVITVIMAIAVAHRTDVALVGDRHFQTIRRDARIRVSLASAMHTMSVTGNVVVVIGILVMTIFGMD